jgi:hypothetical protein
MDRLMPTFYAEMDIQPGSIHDQIIKDKIHDEAIAKLVGGILLAVVAIALTVVSLGTATPAVVAAGASIGAAGLSTYMAYDEYKQYTTEHAISDAGLADHPSVIWLVLAIAGAGVDMGAVTKTVRALAPAAKALEAGGEFSDFAKAVEALQKSRQIDEQIAAAADKAAAARKSYAAAKGELSMALGKRTRSPDPSRIRRSIARWSRWPLPRSRRARTRSPASSPSSDRHASRPGSGSCRQRSSPR